MGRLREWARCNVATLSRLPDGRREVRLANGVVGRGASYREAKALAEKLDDVGRALVRGQVLVTRIDGEAVA